MIKPILVCLMGFLSFSALSQNWSVLDQTNDTLHFANDSSEVFSFYADSAQSLGNESYIYPQKEFEINDFYAPCKGSAVGDSWLGNLIVESNLGYAFKFNSGTLSLYLDSSTSTSVINGITVSVVNLGKGYDTLYTGQSDSVITFQLNVNGSTSMATCANMQTIVISKNNGLISFPSCFKEYNYFVQGRMKEFKLPKQVNRTSFTFNSIDDFFNYSIGDVLHYDYIVDVGPHSGYGVFNKTVIGKIMTANSLTYTFERVVRNISYGNKDTIFSDTISETYDYNDSKFNRGVSGSVLRPLNTANIAMRIRRKEVSQFGGVHNGLQVNADYWSVLGNCIDIGTPFIYESANEYFVVGIGLVQAYYNYYGGNPVEQNLIHYNIGGVSWGNPRFISIDENELEGISVYPNPTSETLKLSGLEKTLSWSISGMCGRNVLSGKVSNETTQIDVRDVQAGIYILRLENRRAIKFIKQ